MSAKPATVPHWSTDLSNIATPSGGQIASGWTANQLAISTYFNYLQYWAGQWAQYLSDGVFTGPIEVTGALTVTTDITVGGAYKHTVAIERILPASCAHNASSGTATSEGTHWVLGTSTGRITFPVIAAVGETIESWSLYINDAATGTAMTARMFKRAYATGTETALGALKTSTQSGAEILTDNTVSEVVTANNQYYICAIPSGQTGTQVQYATYSVTR